MEIEICGSLFVFNSRMEYTYIFLNLNTMMKAS